MDITIQRLPDGRLQAYGEDLECLRECVTGDADHVGLRIAEVCDDAMPFEEHWVPDEAVDWMKAQRESLKQQVDSHIAAQIAV